MSTSVCWDLTCDGLVKDSHPLNTTGTGLVISAGSKAHLAHKGFSFSSFYSLFAFSFWTPSTFFRNHYVSRYIKSWSWGTQTITSSTQVYRLSSVHEFECVCRLANSPAYVLIYIILDRKRKIPKMCNLKGVSEEMMLFILDTTFGHLRLSHSHSILIYNGYTTEWNTIRSVIIREINKIRCLRGGSLIC